jgi:cytochrome c oxidase subunit 2
MTSDQPQPPADLAPARRPGRGPRLVGIGLLALAAAVVLGGCNLPTFGTFTPVTKQEQDAYSLYQGLTIAAMVVGGIVWGLIIWCLLRYRRTKRQAETGELPKQTRYNIKWEAVYTITPIIMVIGIFVYTVIAEDSADQVVRHPNITVDVTAFQWNWQFNYPVGRGKVIQVLPKRAPTPSPGQASQGEQALASPVEYPIMILPVNKTAHINLVSNDVVHGFYVPAFEFSRYAQPGVTNQFDFTPTKTGLFPGRCTQFCGLYHTEMLFWVRVVSQSAYHHWVATGGRSIPTDMTGKGLPEG